MPGSGLDVGSISTQILSNLTQSGQSLNWNQLTTYQQTILASTGWSQAGFNSELGGEPNRNAYWYEDPSNIPVVLLIASQLGPLSQSFLVACITTSVCNDLFIGIQPFDEMPYEKGYERHHLIEQRFAQILGVDPGSIPTIYLTPEQHDVITALWRNEIGYINDLSQLNTSNATINDVWNAAQNVYSGSSDILIALRIFMFGK